MLEHSSPSNEADNALVSRIIQSLPPSDLEQAGLVQQEQLQAAQYALDQLGAIVNKANGALSKADENPDLVSQKILQATHRLADMIGELAHQIESQSEDDRRALAQACMEDAQTFELMHNRMEAKVNKNKQIESNNNTKAKNVTVKKEATLIPVMDDDEDEKWESLQPPDGSAATEDTMSNSEESDLSEPILSAAAETSNDSPSSTNHIIVASASSTLQQKQQELEQQHEQQEQQQHEQNQLSLCSQDEIMSAITASASLLRDVESTLRMLEKEEADDMADVAVTVAQLFVSSLQSLHSTLQPHDLIDTTITTTTTTNTTALTTAAPATTVASAGPTILAERSSKNKVKIEEIKDYESEDELNASGWEHEKAEEKEDGKYEDDDEEEEIVFLDVDENAANLEHLNIQLNVVTYDGDDDDDDDDDGDDADGAYKGSNFGERKESDRSRYSVYSSSSPLPMVGSRTNGLPLLAPASPANSEISSDSDTSKDEDIKMAATQRLALRKKERLRLLWPPLGEQVKKALAWGKDTASHQPLLAVALGLTMWPSAIVTSVMAAPVVIADHYIQSLYTHFQETPFLSGLEKSAAQLYRTSRFTLTCGKLVTKQTLRVAKRQVKKRGGTQEIVKDVGRLAIERAKHPVETAGMALKGVGWGVGMFKSVYQSVSDVNKMYVDERAVAAASAAGYEVKGSIERKKSWKILY